MSSESRKAKSTLNSESAFAKKSKPPKDKLYIGTSGWSYHWENFYPKDLASAERLRYYSSRFRTVEVNYSFYHLPRKSTYEKWVGETPRDFLFALKLSRYITHIKRLKGIKAPLKEFLSRAKSLGSQLGPLLVQLPPSFKLDSKRLKSFLETARDLKEELKMPGLKFAFEFRHKSWFERTTERERAIAILKKHKAAFVFAHSSRYPYPEDEPLSADFVYLRFHGPGELFASEYKKEGLKSWVPKIKLWLKKGLEVYIYFNNDFSGFAPKDARTLFDLI